jgi:phage FluMu protein Com
MIRVRCANCGLEIGIAATHAGGQTKCPKCKGSIRIPGKDQADASTTEASSLEPDGLRLDHALFDIPAKPTSEAYSGDEPAATLNQQVQELEEEFTGRKPEPPPSRKYPWLLDVLLYPASKPALVIFGIIILIPLVIEIVAVMLGPFLVFCVNSGPFYRGPSGYIRILVLLRVHPGQRRRRPAGSRYASPPSRYSDLPLAFLCSRPLLESTILG